MFWGILVRYFVKCASAGIYLMFLMTRWSYRFGGGRSERSSAIHVHHIIGRVHTLLTVDVDLPHLTEVVLSSFSTVEVTLPHPLSLLYSLEGSHYVLPKIKEWSYIAPQGQRIYINLLDQCLGAWLLGKKIKTMFSCVGKLPGYFPK